MHFWFYCPSQVLYTVKPNFSTFSYLHVQPSIVREKKKKACQTNFSLIFFFLTFGWMGSVVVVLRLSHPAAYGILIPWPGIEPMSPALEGRFLTTGPPGNFLNLDSWPRTSDALLILPGSHTSLIHSLSHHSKWLFHAFFSLLKSLSP